MTREEWAVELIRKLASGHMNSCYRREARDYLEGKDPPVKWQPKDKGLI